MGVEAGIDSHELSDLVQSMSRLAEKEYPAQAKNFLRKQANKARRILRKETRSATKKKTGNLLKGIDREKIEKREDGFQIRVVNNANHAHLIEHGHELWVPVKQKGGGYAAKDTGRQTKGLHPAATTVKQMKADYAQDVEDWVDELLKEGFEL